MYKYRQSLIIPMQAFVQDRVRVDCDAMVLIDDLHAAYNNWCETNGKHAVTRTAFARLFRAVVDRVVNVRVRSNGQAAHYYKGVTLHETQ